MASWRPLAGLVSGAVAGAIAGLVGLFATSPAGGAAAAAVFGGGFAWGGGDVGISLADKISGGTQQKDHLDQALNDLGGPEGFTQGQKTNLRKLKDPDWRELLMVRRPVKGQFRSNVVANKEDRQGIRKQLVKLIADGSTLEEAKEKKAELIESKKVVEPKEKGPNVADVFGDIVNT